MSLADTIKAAVSTANHTTASLQETVTHKVWTGQTGFGAPQFSIVPRKALVEQRLHQRRMSDGRLVECRAKLTILETIVPVAAVGRVNPVDSRDEFTLADGTTGIVVDVEGLRNPDESTPYLVEIYLGAMR